jgi:hypothetical protein
LLSRQAVGISSSTCRLDGLHAPAASACKHSADAESKRVAFDHQRAIAKAAGGLLAGRARFY